MILGVGDISIAKLYAEALQMAGFKRAWVVHSHEGLDEITPSGTTFVWEVDGDKPIAHFSIHPSDFGLQVCTCFTKSMVSAMCPNGFNSFIGSPY
jgi:anthranilate phosphoribosyltransferase